jgi:hypothetical protein
MRNECFDVLRLSRRAFVALGWVALVSLGVFPAAAQESPVFSLAIPNTTQGPLWPPSAVTDANGDFIVIGNILTNFGPPGIFPVPGAALISKETIPPLDENGRESFLDAFGSAYTVLRPLDLTPGSADLDLVLHSNSFGPMVGDFGGGPRIPREGESTYNLNSLGFLCPELFPAPSQLGFTRPSFPLHQVPVAGFRGDQVAYDVETGQEVAREEAGLDARSQAPITLGEWLRGTAQVDVELVAFDEQAGGFTAARFDFTLRGLLPRSLYHVVFLRTNGLVPLPILQGLDPVALPNLFVTDENGDAELSRVVPNPFPDPAIDDRGLRVQGLAVVFRSDFQNMGACTGRFGAGVDIHAAFSTFAQGIVGITELVTVEAP